MEAILFWRTGCLTIQRESKAKKLSLPSAITPVLETLEDFVSACGQIGPLTEPFGGGGAPHSPPETKRKFCNPQSGSAATPGCSLTENPFGRLGQPPERLVPYLTTAPLALVSTHLKILKVPCVLVPWCPGALHRQLLGFRPSSPGRDSGERN